jgi:Haem-NO-binding
MKGIVFTEFIELVEETFSLDMVDDILDDCDLDSGGAYTSVGLYDYSEMLQLVNALSKRSGMPVADLLHVFGKHLIKKFSTNFSSMFESATDAFTFLEGIDNHVHVEVRKLYPDAELPQLGTERPDDHTLLMRYQSNRPFAELAYGLMKGAIDYFGENIEIDRQDEKTDGRVQTFILKKVG